MMCKSCHTYGKQPCAPFTAKLVGGDFIFDGACATFEPTIGTGTIYGAEFIDGKLVGYITELPVLNPPVEPCAMVPVNCGTGGGTGGDVTVAADPANLTVMSPLGLLTVLHVRGVGVTITGNGTALSPLQIKADTPAGGGGSGVYAGGDGIDIDGTNPPIISFNGKTAGGKSGTVGQLTFVDGLLTRIDDPEGAGSDIMHGGTGISIENISDRYLVSLEQVSGWAAKTLNVGRHSINVDNYGRVIAHEKSADLPTHQRSIPYPGGVMEFDGDGVLLGTKPSPVPLKQVFELKNGTTASGSITITLPNPGPVLITVSPFGLADAVSVSALYAEMMETTVLSPSSLGICTYKAESKKFDLIYKIEPPKGESDLPRGKTAHIIVEYLG